VAIAVALADKLDQLAGFFAVGERPTGSGDPFALRRAALGVIRIIRENGLRLGLRELLSGAAMQVPGVGAEEAGQTVADLLDFLAERLRVQIRSEGARHDVVAAVFGAAPDDDLVRLLARADALRVLIESPDGANLLTAYRRAANILRIEDRKDGPHKPPADPALLRAPEEIALADALAKAEPAARKHLDAEDFTGAMAALAALRAPVDDFFDRVTVNDPAPELRRNRLALLAGLRAAMDAVADLSKIEG
jgi:glycyl-tRNA synthetase beta chain